MQTLGIVLGTLLVWIVINYIGYRFGLPKKRDLATRNEALETLAKRVLNFDKGLHIETKALTKAVQAIEVQAMALENQGNDDERVNVSLTLTRKPKGQVIIRIGVKKPIEEMTLEELKSAEEEASRLQNFEDAAMYKKEYDKKSNTSKQ